MDIWTKISILSCILSILVVVLAYYGIFRYMTLKNNSCVFFAEHYMKLPRVTSTGKVVVCMYLNDFENDLSNNMTLKSILDQTVHPDQIRLITNINILKIPDFLKKDSIIVTQHVNSRHKSSAFTVPLQTQKESDTKIIIVTDGVVYGPDFIETMVEESEKYPNDIIFVEGYDMTSYVDGSKKPINYKLVTPIFVNIEYGVLIKPEMFKKLIEQLSDLDAPSAMLSVNIHVNSIMTRNIKYNEIFHANKNVKPDEQKMLQFYAVDLKL